MSVLLTVFRSKLFPLCAVITSTPLKLLSNLKTPNVKERFPPASAEKF